MSQEKEHYCRGEHLKRRRQRGSKKKIRAKYRIDKDHVLHSNEPTTFQASVTEFLKIPNTTTHVCSGCYGKWHAWRLTLTQDKTPNAKHNTQKTRTLEASRNQPPQIDGTQDYSRVLDEAASPSPTKKAKRASASSSISPGATMAKHKELPSNTSEKSAADKVAGAVGVADELASMLEEEEMVAGEAEAHAEDAVATLEEHVRCLQVQKNQVHIY